MAGPRYRWPYGLYEVTGVNSAGDVVGDLVNNQGGGTTTYQYGFVYSNGTFQIITSLYNANAINSRGQIVGTLGTSSPTVAALYSNGSVQSLGTLGGSTSTAYAINSAGVIVGGSYLSDNSTQHAFLYRNGSMVDINTLVGNSPYVFTRATGINEAGQIAANGFTTIGSVCVLTPPAPTPTDGPLPIWSYLLLALGLAEISRRRLQRTRPPC